MIVQRYEKSLDYANFERLFSTFMQVIRKG